MVTVYLPGTTLAKKKRPESLVVADLAMPVLASTKVTLAPTTAAAVGSATTPSTVPVLALCAPRLCGARDRAKTRKARNQTTRGAEKIFLSDETHEPTRQPPIVSSRR